MHFLFCCCFYLYIKDNIIKKEIEMARVLISMPEEFLSRIDEVAEGENRTRSELIREALRTYIHKQRVKENALAMKNAKVRMYRWRRNLMAEGKYEKQRFPGIITFSADINHMILYVVCVLGILVMISDVIFHYISEYIMFPILSIIFLAFAIHCIVDGENYKLFKAIKEGMDKGYEV
jgi:Arc/MetJ-type ribon-helix-helix transcriptional regulator